MGGQSPGGQREGKWAIIGALAGVAGVVVAILFGVTQCSSTSPTSTPTSTTTSAEPGSSTSSNNATSDMPTTSQKKSPPVESSVPDDPSPKDGRTASQAFLADMEPIHSSPYTESASINGRTYPHSVEDRIGGCQTKESFAYNIGRDWSMFTATVGVRDDSESDSVVQFEVYVDGNLAFSSGDVAYGQSREVSIPVAGVLNLKLAYVFTKGDMGLCSNAGWAVWGDPMLSR